MTKKQKELVLHFYKQQQKTQETKPKSYHCEWTAVKSSEHQASSRSQRSSKEATTENKHISLYTT
jgi:hypothetical protein